MSGRVDIRRIVTTPVVGPYIAFAVVLSLVLGGCATEVIQLDSTATTVESPAESAAVELSSATLAELTVVLRDEVALLGRAVFDGERDEARLHLERIDLAWEFAEPLIVAQYGELADQITYDLRRVLELARSAVERNRPADADKATAFLRLALQSLDA